MANKRMLSPASRSIFGLLSWLAGNIQHFSRLPFHLFPSFICDLFIIYGRRQSRVVPCHSYAPFRRRHISFSAFWPFTKLAFSDSCWASSSSFPTSPKKYKYVDDSVIVSWVRSVQKTSGARAGWISQKVFSSAFPARNSLVAVDIFIGSTHAAVCRLQILIIIEEKRLYRLMIYYWKTMAAVQFIIIIKIQDFFFSNWTLAEMVMAAGFSALWAIDENSDREVFQPFYSLHFTVGFSFSVFCFFVSKGRKFTPGRLVWTANWSFINLVLEHTIH